MPNTTDEIIAKLKEIQTWAQGQDDEKLVQEYFFDGAEDGLKQLQSYVIQAGFKATLADSHLHVEGIDPFEHDTYDTDQITHLVTLATECKCTLTGWGTLMNVEEKEHEAFMEKLREEAKERGAYFKDPDEDEVIH